jgi:uncharacterized membrane protein
MTRDNLLNGLLIGAGLMYYLDPDRGRRRRAIVRDQVVHYGHRADRAMDTAARDIRNRAVGMASEARGRIRGTEDATPAVVEARVRSALGRAASHPGALGASADHDGRITLTGPVLADEVDRVISAVESVRGVRDVIDRMEIHQSPAGVPGLQGIGRVPRQRLDVLQENWAPATRLLMGLLGGAMAVRGMTQEGPVGGVLTLAGLGVVSRSLSNKDLRRLLGIDAGRNAVEVHKIVTIHAPVSEVFAFWRDYENFPRFMSHLREVRDTGGGRSHWVAEGPAGIPFEWDAETVRVEEDRLITWRSIGTSPIANAGIVRFQPEGDAATRVDIHLSYSPPAGALGHAVASFLGSDPRHLMTDDLVRLKSLLEDGKTTAHHTSVTRDQIRGEQPEDRS